MIWLKKVETICVDYEYTVLSIKKFLSEEIHLRANSRQTWAVYKDMG